jgi:hypothetical protein
MGKEGEKKADIHRRRQTASTPFDLILVSLTFV